MVIDTEINGLDFNVACMGHGYYICIQLLCASHTVFSKVCACSTVAVYI